MFRYTRTVTIKNSHSMQGAIRAGMEICGYVNSTYGTQMKFGVELFGGTRLHWFFDAESIDAMTQMNAKMMQDANYFGLLEKIRPFVLDGSLKDEMVQLIG